MGAYDVPNYSSDLTVVFTNKIIVTPVRGAGRPQGIYIVERMLDIAARELGIDPMEIRRMNFIPPDAFPYDHKIIDQAFVPLIFDSGNYEPAFDKALDMLGYEDFIKNEQPRLREEGKHVGIGIVPFVETTGVGPYEGARVSVEPSGKISAATGIGTQGQSHMTSFAQIIAEQLGVEVNDVSMVTGDTAEFHWGTGTFASREQWSQATRLMRQPAMSARKCLNWPVKSWKLQMRNLYWKTVWSGWLICRISPSVWGN